MPSNWWFCASSNEWRCSTRSTCQQWPRQGIAHPAQHMEACLSISAEGSKEELHQSASRRRRADTSAQALES